MSDSMGAADGERHVGDSTLQQVGFMLKAAHSTVLH